jgi:reductive dehalogenase
MSKLNPLARLYVKQLPPEDPPYVIDEEMYRRFDQRNNLTVGRPNWDDSVQSFTKRTGEIRHKLIEKDRVGYHIQDYALMFAAGTSAWSMGSAINHANRGVTSWKPLRPMMPGKAAPWEGTPEEATAMVKKVARYVGADLVGIAPLNRKWIYSHAFWADGTHKEIVFENIDEAVETDTQLVIPEKMKWVVVMGTKMDESVISYTPTPTGCSETQLTYSKMASQLAGLAEFIRGIGYQAIPSMNGVGLTIPMAIDAGFGEQGRNGKLITPEFGPSLRLCKVFTDLPLMRDNPMRFGVIEFCEVCQKCAEDCPSNSIPRGPREWTGPSISNNPGNLTWQIDHETCRRYWAMGNATNCTACIRSCPFTKAPGLSHELVRTFISNAPVFNPFMRQMDDLFGYGKQKDASVFWLKA